MSKEPCKHLANLIPRVKDGELSLATIQGFTEMSGLDDVYYEDECHRLERKLKDSGFNPTQVYMIMDRFVSNLSIKEMSKKYGRTANEITQDLKTLAKEVKEKDVFNESI